MKTVYTDFLVIGSGIAGLTFALKISERFPEAQICMVTKDAEEESNTKYAQGGIAAVLNEINDSYDSHIRDTLIAGAGLCNEMVVQMVVLEGAKQLKNLIKWGVVFDANENNTPHLAMEGGHSCKRILHHKDFTGYEIETKLLKQVRKRENIAVLSQYFALKLIDKNALHSPEKDGLSSNTCYGAYVLNTKKQEVCAYIARVTLLATGGVGQVYKNTTNPAVATGDGIAMAHQLGAKISGMEFIQFHPTALKLEKGATSFLISEAVRGFGGRLVNASGELFVHKYDARGDLAPRDIVARAVHFEMKKNQTDCVYLDCSHLNIEAFKEHFSSIYATLKKWKIDVAEDLIPVVPAAHYLCGGIETDTGGKTSIKNLLACGECANTGLHGANRLASNSLLEAIVFAERCYESAIQIFETSQRCEMRPKEIACKPAKDDDVQINLLKAALKNLMQRYVGIVRNDRELHFVHQKLIAMQQSIPDNVAWSREWKELKNMMVTASLIVQQSIARKQNIGGFHKQNERALLKTSENKVRG